ncbi:UDP-N-acetylmuramoyl-L-alanyl-D-glutamate--2,6-diaminopimelate ligase [Rubeoparvulum massiliense]|uniref:UDP-N-acetylmuramoyl-L-alanyl-D-glutamate--2, 6-diaminopimelate ligase n=1 Tax=Rubeoparvulum massiliense TaxID=1631346 RepID=UPI0009E4ACDC|nr:UDP-N-acetylmuramoyl-L-alanyl-D-glutamate--2,6-diaminopimelate ligase [Rubeoparvulum massiliense]
MNLSTLIHGLPFITVVNHHECTITKITDKSNEVVPGTLFVCIPGYRVDGHQFAEEAVAKGAVAIVASQPVEVTVPTLYVRNTRRALAILLDRFYDHPTQHLRLIGVTGTNGKSTVTYLLEQIFQDAGYRTGLIGTIERKVGTTSFPTNNTTPDPVTLQETFALMRKEKTDYAMMEVSSHALTQGRVWGCKFRSAIFTNLTQDHLDYHHTKEAYAYAKSLLFAQLGNAYEGENLPVAILNGDDPASKLMAEATAAPVLTYAIHEQADVRATNVTLNSDGVQFIVESFAGSAPFALHLMGRFNVYNALAVITAALLEGLSLEQIKASLEKAHGVPGRCERVEAGQPFRVIVDYAHTPDGLQNVLQTMKEVKEGRLISVCGCGGDRDRSKRPLMAQISTQLADLSVFTSDNPRTEVPEAILQDMLTGVQNDPDATYEVIENRRDAIQYAIAQAEPGDIVIIAGKGHETYQEINGVRHHFDDREEAAEAIHLRYHR